ncbi:pseudouridine synthase [Jonesia quinghaiensis]|uniref:pseudouridine synthase n=1 Tax=Jonesia quinghaiensis TaxID=262806 RepID=UPI0003F7250E|nr:pseudouridine synthase [Jonesia quinghaiensis]
MVRRRRSAPLPIRDGINPVRLQMPHPGQLIPRAKRPHTSAPRDAMGLSRDALGRTEGVQATSEVPDQAPVYAPDDLATVAEFLAWRFPHDADTLLRKLGAGEVVDEVGRPLHLTSPYCAGGLIYLYRDPDPEPEVPFAIEVVHEDDDLLVIDKPHFLATTPKGRYVTETALVRLRKETSNPHLSPAHRLDRLTAGVLVFTKRPELRSVYQDMFSRREVTKVYQAVAPVRNDLDLPTTIRSRLLKEHGVMRAHTVPGEPNTETLVTLSATRQLPTGHDAGVSEVGLYTLYPHTGKTHQLRIHMAALGVGIVYDNYYPDFYDVERDDYRHPLQLLSWRLGFTDPVTGVDREFVSQRTLEVWEQALDS